MESIVVTVTNAERSYTYDFEIPLGTELGTVFNKIVDIILRINPSSRLDYSRSIIDARNGNELNKAVSAEDNAIWNGDYLIII